MKQSSLLGLALTLIIVASGQAQSQNGIDRAENARLSGMRVGPYSFFAKPKGSLNPYTYEVTIQTRVTYIDKKGRTVSLASAVDLREEVLDIAIRPLAAEKCFTPLPDQNP